jgi:catechol 2,3-dioxygenase-like lactoylglutathione lyase family enzyme
MLATQGNSTDDYVMKENTGLNERKIIAFIPVVDTERAKVFYRDTLGLALVTEELPFALVFDANGIMLRLAIVEKMPGNPGTILGWQVPDIISAAQDLQSAGVLFERYEYMQQDELGIWATPTGAKVAWFKDPDGNVLSISEHSEVTK